MVKKVVLDSTGLDRALHQVREFHEKFGHPWEYSPKMLTGERKKTRVKWMREEIDEFHDAETLVEQVDALADLIYFVLGTYGEMGVEVVQKVFDVVHKANMRKHTVKAPDGKTTKPKDWTGPEREILLLLSNLCLKAASEIHEKSIYETEEVIRWFTDPRGRRE